MGSGPAGPGEARLETSVNRSRRERPGRGNPSPVSPRSGGDTGAASEGPVTPAGGRSPGAGPRGPRAGRAELGVLGTAGVKSCAGWKQSQGNDRLVEKKAQTSFPIGLSAGVVESGSACSRVLDQNKESIKAPAS